VFGDVVAVLRLPALLAALGSLFLAIVVARRMAEEHPFYIAALLGTLPEPFVYSFQINGSTISILLGYWALLAYIKVHDSTRMGASRVLYLSMPFAISAIQNPFSLGYAGAAGLLAVRTWFSAADPGAKRHALGVGVAALLAVGLWLAFLSLSQESIVGGIERHSAIVETNTSILGGLYPGNLFIVLAFLGGLFPLLPWAVPRQLSWKVTAPVVLTTTVLSSWFLPLSGGTYDERFHTIFTMVGARALELWQGPSWLGSLLFYGLVALGTFNVIHVVCLSWTRRFAPYFLISAAVSLTGLLVDGYISSRLALPGIVGMLFFCEAVMTGSRWARVAQFAYQTAWCVAYSVALGAKWGFLGF
jgi:hypothetical protein